MQVASQLELNAIAYYITHVLPAITLEYWLYFLFWNIQIIPEVLIYLLNYSGAKQQDSGACVSTQHTTQELGWAHYSLRMDLFVEVWSIGILFQM